MQRRILDSRFIVAEVDLTSDTAVTFTLFSLVFLRVLRVSAVGGDRF